MRQLVGWIFVALVLVSTITSAQNLDPETVPLGPIARAALAATASGQVSLQVRLQASQQSQKTWGDRHPILYSLLIAAGGGAAIGAGLGAILGGGDPDADPPKESHRLQSAGAGAAFGFLIPAAFVLACGFGTCP